MKEIEEVFSNKSSKGCRNKENYIWYDKKENMKGGKNG